jgi:hypothetical protein
MDIERARVAKQEMEEFIRQATLHAVMVFRDKTGLSPQSMSIELIDVTAPNDRNRRLTVGEVRADVSL